MKNSLQIPISINLFRKTTTLFFAVCLVCVGVAQNVSDSVFTNVIRIDNKHITKRGNKTLIDVSIPTDIQTPIIFFNISVENKIPRDLLFRLYYQYKHILFIVPDWDYYENSKDIKPERAFTIYKLERSEYKYAYNFKVVDSLKTRGNIPKIQFADTQLKNEEVNIYYTESFYPRCGTGVTEKFYRANHDFWEKYRGKIGNTYELADTDFRRAYVKYYTLSGLTTQGKIKFLEERSLVDGLEFSKLDVVSTPHIYTPFRHRTSETEIPKPKIEISEEELPPQRYPDIKAEFPGGMAALMKFLGNEIGYPQDALDDNVSGTVIVEFVVKADGTIGNVEVIKKVHPNLDKEAVRVVKLMPRWKPGSSNKIAVSSYFQLPVQFKIEKPKLDENVKKN